MRNMPHVRPSQPRSVLRPGTRDTPVPFPLGSQQAALICRANTRSFQFSFIATFKKLRVAPNKLLYGHETLFCALQTQKGEKRRRTQCYDVATADLDIDGVPTIVEYT
jgi:hypothetical protein